MWKNERAIDSSDYVTLWRHPVAVILGIDFGHVICALFHTDVACEQFQDWNYGRQYVRTL